ncbi:MAG: threonine aldolase [Solirubrobacterales bacterium]|nr:threonine aldolase [Solirubrobacterales bacterium]
MSSPTPADRAKPAPPPRAERRGFASDNHAGIHPEVLRAIAAANEAYAGSYGDDSWTAAAEALFRSHLGESARAHFVFNGSAANVLALDCVCRQGARAVICAESSHLHQDEAGAPERIAGLKLLVRPTPDGRLTPGDVARSDDKRGDVHYAQPGAVSITQSTELGTVYSPGEIRAIAAAAHERGMCLHLDGARLANAAASLGVSLREITTDAGVDVVSFGGTKNGLLLGEAVVFLTPELGDGFPVLRKAGMQLASKMRFVSAQFEALLGEGDLWLVGAEHANRMATRLAEAVAPIEGVELAHPVEANGVFARLERAAIERLHAELGEHAFYIWDSDRDEVRWMCSWDTTPEDVDRFAERVAAAVGAR